MRPFLVEFLDEMSSYFELIIYTASHSEYADRVLNFIENKRKYFAHRLYKQHCVIKPGVFVFKNLDVLCGNRDIKDIVIADNSVRNFALSIRNGIPIKEYKGQNPDTELVYLAKYLRVLADEDDIRIKIKEDFAAFLCNHYQSS